MFKILHWNINKSYEKLQHIFNSCEYSDYIISLNEPNCQFVNDFIEKHCKTIDTVIVINNFKIFINGNAALLIPKKYSVKRIPVNVSDICAVQIIVKNKSYHFISIYGKIGSTNTKKSFWQKISQQLQNFHTPLVIMADFNYEDELWSPRREKFMKFLPENLSIKSIFQPITENYTFVRGNVHTYIDAIVISPSVIVLTRDRIRMCTNDHLMLKATILFTTGYEHSMIRRMVFTPKKLKLLPMNEDPNLNNEHPMVKNIKQIINYPETYGKYYIRDQPFLTRGIRYMRRKARKDKNFELFELIKRNRKKFNPSTQANLKLKQSNGTEISRFWKAYNQITNSSLEGIIDVNRCQDKYRVSLTNHLSDFTTNRPIFSDNIKPVSGQLNEIHWNKLIQNMKRFNSSLSADEYTKKTWIKMFDLNTDIIKSIIIFIFRYSHIPSILRVLGAGFIPKTDTEKLRMIKTPNYLFKCVDILLSYRLHDVLKDYLLPNSQYAYKLKDRRSSFMLEILFCLDKPNFAVIDLQAAFDEVDVSTVVDRVGGIDPSLAQLIKTFCEKRYVKLKYEKCTLFKTEERYGVPQGCASSGIIFIMALDTPIRKLNQRQIYLKSYADDIVFAYEKNDNIDDLINQVADEMSTIHLQLNKAKTKFVTTMYKDVKITGYLYSIPLYKNNIQQRCRTVTQQVLSNFRFQKNALVCLSFNFKRLLLSGVIFPKIMNIIFDTFKHDKHMYLVVVKETSRITSCLELLTVSSTYIKPIYGLTHPLIQTWAEIFEWCKRKTLHINDDFMFDIVDPLPVPGEKERNEIKKRFSQQRYEQEIWYRIIGDKLLVSFDKGNTALTTINSEGWDKYLRMIYLQLHYYDTKRSPEPVIVIPKQLILHRDTNSLYSIDAIQLLSRLFHIRWTWCYGEVIRYTFTPHTERNIKITWISTVKWRKRVRELIDLRHREWLIESCDIWTLNLPDKRITNKQGFIGKTPFWLLTRTWNNLHQNRQLLPCCEMNGDRTHCTLTCPRILTIVAEHLGETWHGNIYKELSTYIKITNELLQASTLYKNAIINL